MSRLLLAPLLSFACVLPTACSSSAAPHPGSQTFDKPLAQALPLFEQHNLPNSMAREPGFDLAAHLADLEQRRRQVTSVFHCAEGAAYLASRIDAETDDMAVLAILQILHESGRPEARLVFMKYANHPSSTVSEWANRYLALDVQHGL